MTYKKAVKMFRVWVKEGQEYTQDTWEILLISLNEEYEITNEQCADWMELFPGEVQNG